MWVLTLPQATATVVCRAHSTGRRHLGIFQDVEAGCLRLLGAEKPYDI